jgi:hypothetical protein
VHKIDGNGKQDNAGFNDQILKNIRFKAECRLNTSKNYAYKNYKYVKNNCLASKLNK